MTTKIKRSTNKQIHEVCEMLQEGFNTKEIENKTRVRRQTILDILNDKSFKNISINYKFTGDNKMKGSGERYSKEQIHEVCKLLQDGLPQEYIYKKTKVKLNVIRNIIYSNSYFEISGLYDISFRNTKSDVLHIDVIHRACSMIEKGVFVPIIVKEVGLKEGIIRALLNKIIYRDISNQYDFSWYCSIPSTKEENVS